MEASVLDTSSSSAAQAVGLLGQVALEFEKSYRSAVAARLRPGLPVTVCTIYNGFFSDPQYQRFVSTALTVFNDSLLPNPVCSGRA
jgi:hypothetical protein